VIGGSYSKLLAFLKKQARPGMSGKALSYCLALALIAVLIALPGCGVMRDLPRYW
jgi:hypothetical protein